MDEAEQNTVKHPETAVLDAEPSPGPSPEPSMTPAEQPQATVEENGENLDEIDLALQESNDSSSDSSKDSSDDSSDNDDSSNSDESDGELSDDSSVLEDIPRTANEIEPEIPTLPADFEISEKTKIELAGSVFSVGANQVVVQAQSSGEYKILDEGTIFCTGDRKPLGLLYETFGPVEKPFYVIRIQSEQDQREVHSKNDEIFYIATSKFTFTDQYRQKGTDASNLHDEEVPLEEQEFSDDEQEAFAKGKKRRKRTKGGKKKVQVQDQAALQQVPMPRPMPRPQAQAVPVQMPPVQPVAAMPAAQTQPQLLQWQQQLQMQQMQLQAQWQMMQQFQQQPQQFQPQPMQFQPQPQQPQQHQQSQPEEEPHQWP